MIKRYSYSIYLVLLVIWMHAKIYMMASESHQVFIEKAFFSLKFSIDALDIIFFIIVFIYGCVLAVKKSDLTPETSLDFKFPLFFLILIAVPYIVFSAIFNKIF